MDAGRLVTIISFSLSTFSVWRFASLAGLVNESLTVHHMLPDLLQLLLL